MSSAEKGENNPIDKRSDMERENSHNTTNDEGLNVEEKVKHFKTSLLR